MKTPPEQWQWRVRGLGIDFEYFDDRLAAENFLLTIEKRRKPWIEYNDSITFTFPTGGEQS